MPGRRSREARDTRSDYASDGTDARARRVQDGSVDTVLLDCADDCWLGHDRDARTPAQLESFGADRALIRRALIVHVHPATSRSSDPTTDRYRDAKCARDVAVDTVRNAPERVRSEFGLKACVRRNESKRVGFESDGSD